MDRIRFTSTAAAVLALVFPASALAGTVSVPDPNAYPPAALFKAKTGERNRLVVAPGNSPQHVFSDSGAPLTAGPGCSAGVGSVQCAPSFVVDVNLGDRDDTADVHSTSGGRILAGSGDDTVVATSDSSPYTVYGDGGDDELSAGGIGGQTLNGGDGDDMLHVGGFEGGATGNGGGGDDTIEFSAVYSATASIDGGSGNDRITLQPGVQSTVAAGSGNDTVTVAGDAPLYRTGGYSISGQGGSDTINGGPDADTIDGGSEGDVINVVGGAADDVTCGRGFDLVHADASDTLAPDCEIKIVVPA
jgi:Ca2+-binding RTX toxin-like protein